MPKQISCSDFAEFALLYGIGELSEGERAGAEAHAERCAACRAVLQGEMALQEAVATRVRASATAQFDDADVLLAQCRSELAETLDDEAASLGAYAASGWRAWLSPTRCAAWCATTFHRALAFHPGWSTAALLIVGALVGTFGGTLQGWYRATAMALPGQPVMTVSSARRLSDEQLETMGIEGIRWEPQQAATPAHVELQLHSDRPVVLRGPADDAEIRRVLTYVIAHGQRFDPGVRLDSLDILLTHVGDPQVRAALCEAALRDQDPAVRLKALEALRGLGADATVRQAMLGALVEDANSGVRIEAINGIEALLASREGSEAAVGHSSPATPAAASVGLPAVSPSEFPAALPGELPAALSSELLDPRMLGILRDRERNDSNNYVRLRSAAVLGRLASMQTPTETHSRGPRP